MNLLIFSESFYPHGGGAELATWLYSKGLAEKGFKVTVVTRQFPGESSAALLDNGIEIYRLPADFMFNTRYYTLANVGLLTSSFIVNLIRKSNVIYVPCGWYSVIPIAKLHKKPVIVHLHNYSLICSTSLMYNFAEQKIKPSTQKSLILHEMLQHNRGSASIFGASMMNEFIGQHYYQLGKFADAFIFVSNAQRNLILSKIPEIKEKSCVIFNPIPPIPLIKTEGKGIGYFGGRSHVKGFQVLINALNSLNRTQGVETYLPMTSPRQAKLKLSNGVTLNISPKVNLASIMKKISIVVVPSLCPEPSPYTLIESMAYGKLVIAARVGGMPEILEGAGFGVKMVQPGNPNEISDALDSFSALNLGEINELGLKNREFITRKFVDNTSFSSFIRILDKLNSHTKSILAN